MLDVLVAGAGTTGLTVALHAHDHGARVRVVDRRPGRPRPSRALIVHPRTLEVLRPLGVTDELLAVGDPTPEAHLHLGGRVVRARLDRFDLDDTPFPHLLLVRQAEVEAVLAAALRERGVDVEWGRELVDVEARAGEVVATVTTEGAAEHVRSRFLAGCDGARSAVRAGCGASWRGGPHAQQVVLADLRLDGVPEPSGVHVAPTPSGLVFLFPLGDRAPWRLLATRPGATGASPGDGTGPTIDDLDVAALVEDAPFGARVRGIDWSAVVPLEHRVARPFRQGPVVLAGDAAHAHSPAGGQGMNTGIQDAANLGWKLALAARHDPTSPGVDLLLDSYDAERRPVADSVVRLTRVIFWAEAGTDPLARTARAGVRRLGPVAIPALLRRRRLVAEIVRSLSQLRIHHRRSPLSRIGRSSGRHGLRAGDRLPDRPVSLATGATCLHDLCAHAGPTVLLERDAPDLVPSDACIRVDVVRLVGASGTEATVVRPDGHVGHVGDVVGALGWLRAVGVVGGEAGAVRPRGGGRRGSGPDHRRGG